MKTMNVRHVSPRLLICMALFTGYDVKASAQLPPFEGPPPDPTKLELMAPPPFNKVASEGSKDIFLLGVVTGILGMHMAAEAAKVPLLFCLPDGVVLGSKQLWGLMEKHLGPGQIHPLEVTDQAVSVLRKEFPCVLTGS
jgi:hypothetical protein